MKSLHGELRCMNGYRWDMPECVVQVSLGYHPTTALNRRLWGMFPNLNAAIYNQMFWNLST